MGILEDAEPSTRGSDVSLGFARLCCFLFSCVYPFNVVSMGGACCLNVEELLNHAGQTWGLRKGYSTRRRMDTQHCSIWLKLYTLLLIIYIYIYTEYTRHMYHFVYI